jgi:hypothetical protein
MMLSLNYGERLWIASIRIPHLTFFVVMVGVAPPFGKVYYGVPRQQKMGYRWKIGNRENIKFWEDQWFGSCSLAIQFWEIYSIIHEKGISVKDVWDGINLKVTF